LKITPKVVGRNQNLDSIKRIYEINLKRFVMFLPVSSRELKKLG
jgi:hypothetical protein